jgi:hypothetical protein
MYTGTVSRGTIHAIGFDDDNVNSRNRRFNFHGTQLSKGNATSPTTPGDGSVQINRV